VIAWADAARSESGLPVQAAYGADALDGFDPAAGLGVSGGFPFTRGVYRSMYAGRPWTMRRCVGFGTAKESNERYHEPVSADTGGFRVSRRHRRRVVPQFKVGQTGKTVSP
jgi:methylmalonyl-CoA mutase N-terminal domain/subunit